MTTPTPALYVGLDEGKSAHHAGAITNSVGTVYDKALPNEEAVSGASSPT